MSYKNFREFEKAYSIPYSKEKYAEVIDLLNRSSEFLTEKEYEENEFTIMLDKARIYSELHQSKECLNTIRSILERGYAFPLHWQRFDYLRSEEDYKPINELNEKLLEKAKSDASFKYEVHLPKSYNPNKKYPLFLSLHGDGADGNIPNHIWYWRPDSLLQKDYIVVYPQSSQVYCHNGFGWLQEPLKSREEIKGCYIELVDKYSIDENQIVIGGFSGGATASIDIVMADVIPAKGFVALSPGSEKIMSFDKAAAKRAAGKSVKGVIFEGEHETEAAVQDMLKVFKEVGFPCKYHINRNIGHWYPDDLGEILIDAVNFITEK
jgi:predicted esterase